MKKLLEELLKRVQVENPADIDSILRSFCNKVFDDYDLNERTYYFNDIQVVQKFNCYVILEVIK